jgi:inosose dehydratase
MSAMPLANAPVSYGVFGPNVDGASPVELLTSIAEAGYAGCELGPPGFFGSVEETATAFLERGLHAVAGYVPIRFTAGDGTFTDDLDRMRTTCRELAATGGGLAILADEGSDVLLSNPARPWDDRSLALSHAQWAVLAERVRRAVDLAAGHGLTCSFHPHISTYVESPWEVERVLDLTDVALTLDIGHIRLAGGDPAACASSWASRIDHVHIKDASVAVLRDAQQLRRPDFDAWWADVCTPLGAGDVDIDGVLDVLVARGYDGWLVVEQDRAPTTRADYPRVAAGQATNLRWLTEHLDAAVTRAGGAR